MAAGDLTKQGKGMFAPTRSRCGGLAFLVALLCAVAVAPAREAAALDPTFRRMVQSLRINDEAAHRATTVSVRP